MTPGTVAGTISTTNVGTFGQFSAGVSAQLTQTGWLRFARLDYRDGDKLQSLSGTAGIRYQFTPDMVVASHGLPVKAPVFKAPVMTRVNWTGFYVGGIAGADYGRSEYIVPGLAGANIHPSGVLLGGTVGYNYQIDKYVLGIEADDSWTNYKGSAQCSPLNTGTHWHFFCGLTTVFPDDLPRHHELDCQCRRAGRLPVWPSYLAT